jgi:sulfatase modifying factor 1
MAEGENPNRPRPPVPPVAGQPLPRMWKSEPEPEVEQPRERKSRKERLAEEKESAEEATAKDAARAKKKAGPKKTGKKDEPKKPKGALIEPTPEMDTYEARQRVRMIVGGGIALLFVGGILYLFGMFRGGPTVDDTPGPDEGQLVMPSNTARPKGATGLEQEAKNLLDNARQIARNGKSDQAIAILKKITATYPKTPAANEARQALDRPSKNLPLFLDESAVLASPGDAPAPKAVDPAPTLNAVGASNPAIRPGVTGEAQLNLPANPSEPTRGNATVAANPGSPSGKALPPGFTARPEAGFHKSGWPNQINSDRDGGTMVFIPSGTYIQGRNDGTLEEAPEHKVILGAYYIDQHEVTNRQYAFYLKETGSRAPAPRAAAKGEQATSASANEELPVVNVSAREAIAFCDWAGKKLPTEAQWEASGRTTDGRLHPWGSAAPVWNKPRQPRQVDPVMSYDLDQSPYGTFDLAGNVWEWTRDLFDPGYYKDLRGQVPSNPTGPTSLKSRLTLVVVKGGSKTWTLTAREGYKLDTKLPHVGFRGVLAIDSPLDAPAVAAPPAAPGAPAQKAGGFVPF